MVKVYSVIFLIQSVFFNVNTQPSGELVKLEFIVFEGSDWCTSCRQFNNEILDNPQFLHFLDSAQIKLTILDFPQRIKLSSEQERTNKQYAEKYNFQGSFPTLYLANNVSGEYRKIDYTRQTPSVFIDQINALLNGMP